MSKRSRLSLAILLLTLAFAEAAEPLYHMVAKGETLYSLARTYGVSVESILAANGLDDASKIMAGTRLSIPRSHKVAKGETLYGIARSYGVSVEELKALNKLLGDGSLMAGQSLLLPLKSGASPVPPPAGGAKPVGGGASATGGTKSAGSGASAGGAQSGVAKPSGSGAVSGGPAAGGASGGGATASGGAATASPAPDPVRVSAKPIDKKVSWPASGEVRYLEGKLFGVRIKTAAGSPAKVLVGGRVVSAGPYRGFGLVAFVQTKSGLIYVYGGNASLSVAAGDQVKAGQELGRIGMDAKEEAPLCYFFVFKDGAALDPASAPRE